MNIKTDIKITTDGVFINTKPLGDLARLAIAHAEANNGIIIDPITEDVYVNASSIASVYEPEDKQSSDAVDNERLIMSASSYIESYAYYLIKCNTWWYAITKQTSDSKTTIDNLKSFGSYEIVQIYPESLNVRNIQIGELQRMLASEGYIDLYEDDGHIRLRPGCSDDDLIDALAGIMRND